ncbi:MAG: hypothetical protein PPP58_07790, partial [Natronomonas sp.]
MEPTEVIGRGRAAVVLSTLMVLSMFAMGAALPAASDDSVDETQPASIDATTQTNPDRTIGHSNLGGQILWQGQTVTVTGLQGDSNYQLRRVTGSSSSSFVAELSTNQAGELTLRTERYDPAEFFIEGPGIQNPRDQRFEIVRQSLTATWSETSINRGETTDLRLRSNRGSYVLNVSAPGLRFADLERIFDDDRFATDHDRHRGDNVIRLQGGSRTDIETTFRDVSRGSYTFTLDVVDSTARTTATATVGQSRADADIRTGVVEEEAGDIAEMTVRMSNTRTAYLVIGGPEANFLDVIELNDRNGDGQVRVQMNTRYMGLNPDDPGVPSAVRPYRAASSGDRITVYRPGDRLSNEQGQTLSQLRSALNIDASLARPIRAADYDVAVATSDDIRRASGNQLNVVNERDSGTLSLSTPSLDDAETFAAPRGAATSGDLQTVRDLSQRDEIAIEDRVAVRIDVSGIFGHLDAEHSGNLARGLVDNRAEGVEFRVEQVDPPGNREPISFDLGGPGVDIRLDEANNHLYAVIDTRNVRTSRSLQTGETYRATFRLQGVDRNENRYDVRTSARDNRAHRGYPYLQPGQTRTVETTFRLSERRASFDGLVNNRL